MAQSSPHAAIIPTESLVAMLPTESFVAMLPFEMAIAMTGRLLALTTETQEAEVRSCKEKSDFNKGKLVSGIFKGMPL